MSTLTVSLIQSDLRWEQQEANLQQLQQKMNAIAEPSELIILPEMFTTGFSMQPEGKADTMDGASIQWMQKMAAQRKAIVTGSIMIQEGPQFYNRLIWMQPNGVFGTYDKRHLFSYAGEHNHFTAGQKRFIGQLKGWKICTQICYDLRFPVWNRLQTANEYDVLMIVANWPSTRIAAWDTLLRARAIENQCYVIAVNRVGQDENGLEYPGHSSVIAPTGEIMYMGKNTEEVKTITLQKELVQQTRERFPFANDKDSFTIHS
ncbi:MAG TPA: amidohydrolase [Chitinophagaceae bacterium]|nr:amidohydrolase [Chitinophagaceae bacterium]